MSLIGSARRRTLGLDPTYQWPASDPPVSGPTSAPYNAVAPLATPTPDATGIATHPSVVDFHGPWHGRRYWMAMTPYANTNDDLENPCILSSSDGTTWEEPSGITNPIDPWPGGNGYNSDTELVYDPDAGRLICYWRAVPLGESGGVAQTLARWSTNGVDWSDAQVVIDSQAIFECVSPSVVRRGEGDWWMFAVDRRAAPAGMSVYTSEEPLTGWTRIATRAQVGTTGIWHADVIWDGSAFRSISVNIASPYDIHAGSSADGVTWETSGVLMTSRAEEWDAKLYRPTMTVRDDSWFDVWYGAVDGDLWRIGRTNMQRSLWPNPPA